MKKTLYCLLLFTCFFTHLYAQRMLDGVYVCGVESFSHPNEQLVIRGDTCYYINSWFSPDTLAICSIIDKSRRWLELRTLPAISNGKIEQKKNPIMKDSIRIVFDFPNFMGNELYLLLSSSDASFNKDVEFRYTSNHREAMVPLGLHDLNITFMNPDSVAPTGGWGEYYGLKYTFTAFQIARGMNDIYVCFPFVEMDFFKRFVFYSEYARILRDGTILWRGRTFKKVRIGDNK